MNNKHIKYPQIKKIIEKKNKIRHLHKKKKPKNVKINWLIRNQNDMKQIYV